jgi:heat shock protein HslJ
MQRHLTAAIACAALIALGACGSEDAADPASPNTGPDNASDESVISLLAGRTFLSSGVDGHTLVDGTQIRLSFESESISASAGCNQLGGTVSVDGDILVVGAMMQTEMGCEQALMEQDTWLGSLLQSRPTLSLEGATLSVTSADATVVLVDRDVADPDLPLVGTTWVVDGLIDGDAISSVPQNTEASMVIADGTATVHTGCNTGTAGVEITDDVITFAPTATTRMACEPDAMRLEAAVISVLQGDVSYSIEAGRLTLFAADGDDATVGLTLTAS